MNWPFFAVAFVLLLPVTVWRIRRANAVVEAALREVAAPDVPAFDPAADDLAAGRDRLRAAIDEQKREQA